MKYAVFFFLLSISTFSFAQKNKAQVMAFELAYEIKGEGEHTVLLEAGMGRDMKDWDGIFSELSQFVRVIRYSRVGNGESTKIKRHFSAEEYAAHSKMLLKTLNVGKAVIHVSHSYGGIIARAFAAKYPETVSAMLLVDPASEHDLDIMRSIDLEKAVEEVMMLKKHDIKSRQVNEYLDYWAKRPMPNYEEIGDIPVVLIATIKKWKKPPILLMTDKGRELMGEYHQAWAQSFPRGKAILTENSYHFIQKEEPELVIKEIKLLIELLNSEKN